VTSKIWRNFPRSKNAKISQIDTFLKNPKISQFFSVKNCFGEKNKIKITELKWW
jgi:hypothetical protein